MEAVEQLIDNHLGMGVFHFNITVIRACALLGGTLILPIVQMACRFQMCKDFYPESYDGTHESERFCLVRVNALNTIGCFAALFGSSLYFLLHPGFFHRQLLVFFAPVLCLLQLCLALCHSPFVYASCYFVLMVLLNCHLTVFNNYSIETSPSLWRGSMFSAAGMIAGVCIIPIDAIIFPMPGALSWRQWMLIASIPNLVGCVLLFTTTVPDSPKDCVARNDHERAFAAIQAIARVNKKHLAEEISSYLLPACRSGQKPEDVYVNLDTEGGFQSGATSRAEVLFAQDIQEDRVIGTDENLSKQQSQESVFTFSKSHTMQTVKRPSESHSVVRMMIACHVKFLPWILKVKLVLGHLRRGFSAILSCAFMLGILLGVMQQGMVYATGQRMDMVFITMTLGASNILAQIATPLFEDAISSETVCGRHFSIKASSISIVVGSLCMCAGMTIKSSLLYHESIEPDSFEQIALSLTQYGINLSFFCCMFFVFCISCSLQVYFFEVFSTELRSECSVVLALITTCSASFSAVFLTAVLSISSQLYLWFYALCLVFSATAIAALSSRFTIKTGKRRIH